jgi:hypothetical protein
MCELQIKLDEQRFQICVIHNKVGPRVGQVFNLIECLK